ncbi:MAG: polysaccharide biosynthesis C-terminal domain-containing protein, partial [Chloroflexota bacterium]
MVTTNAPDQKIESSRLNSLLHQLALYVPARLIPGLVNFFALAIYTRWLSVGSYGRYALVVAVSDLIQVVFFYGLRLGLFRYFQGARRDNKLSELLSTSLAIFVITSIIVSVLWVLTLLIFPFPRGLEDALWLGLPLLLSQALLAQMLEINQANIAPRRYGILASSRALLSISLSFAFIAIFDLREEGVLIGITLGTLIPALIDLPQWLRQVSPKQLSWDTSRHLLFYGMPLMVTFLMKFIVTTSDRFLIEYFRGSRSVGLYVVGYDLTDQTLSMLFLVVNLAGYPLVVRALEEDGIGSAIGQLRQYAILLFGLTLPSCVGLALLAEPLTGLMVGSRFQEMTVTIIPFIAFAAFLAGIKAFYFDLAFQLGLRTGLQIWPVVAGALLNIGLNIWWIPTIGLMGAVYATVAAVAVSLAISIWLGRGIFELPFPVRQFAQILCATMVMGVVIYFIPKLGPHGVTL